MGIFDREKVAKYMSEFAGTMFLTMFVKLAVTNEPYTTGLSIGLGLALLIYNYGYISGAHLNPSVTAALCVRNIPGFPISDRGQVMMYFVSQYLGAIMGGLTAWIIGGDEAAAKYPTVWQDESQYNDDYRLFQALVGETFFTFLLATTVLHTATDQRQGGNQFYGLSIGLSLALGVACIGPISGCCLNTAVWLGTVIPAIASGQTNNGIGDLWVYWVGTFSGGLIAGLWFNLLNGPESLQKAGVKRSPQEELEQHFAVEDQPQ